jgi:large subunit ribosomal protein L4
MITMTKINVYNNEGKKVSERELAPELFGVEINEGVVHFAADVASANSRSAFSHTKTRGEVRGGGRKPWKQKGTGRARHGSRRSPIWVGGGITFGPRKDRNYSKKINRKTKRAALAMALTDKASHEGVVGLEEMKNEAGKTKAMVALLGKLPVGRRILLVLPESNPLVLRASRNLKDLKTVTVRSLNLLDVLRADTVITPLATLDILEESFRK